MKNLFCLMYLLNLAFIPIAQAKLQLPSNLNEADRRAALQIMGPATSTRILSSPYPLGGYEGFELGISRHYVPTSYLSELGNKTASEGDFEYPLLTLGKGLYYDLDLFLSIVPMAQSDSINHFSSQIRYQFWHSESEVFRFSGLIYAGTTTLNNQLNMQSYGYNLIGTSTIDRVSLYIGVGTSFCNGRFIGGIKGITDSPRTEIETLTLAHQLIGIEWPLGSFFWAAEVDRYKIPYYSLKIGYRM
jgi:hypothetical protein